MPVLEVTVPDVDVLGIFVCYYIVIARVDITVVDVDILRPDGHTVGVMGRNGSLRVRSVDLDIMNGSMRTPA